MTEAHKSALLQLFPNENEKIFTLKGFVYPGSNEDVHDPFGGSLETYRKTFNELTTVIEGLEQKLMDR